MAARGASRLAWCLRRVGVSGDWLLLEAGTQVSRAGSGRAPRGLWPLGGVGQPRRGHRPRPGRGAVTGAARPEPHRGVLFPGLRGAGGERPSARFVLGAALFLHALPGRKKSHSIPVNEQPLLIAARRSRPLTPVHARPPRGAARRGAARRSQGPRRRGAAARNGAFQHRQRARQRRAGRGRESRRLSPICQAFGR